MYALYSLLTAAGMLLLSPYFLIRGLIQGKYLSNIPERLGWRFPPELRARDLLGRRKNRSGFMRYPSAKFLPCFHLHSS